MAKLRRAKKGSEARLLSRLELARAWRRWASAADGHAAAAAAALRAARHGVDTARLKLRLALGRRLAAAERAALDAFRRWAAAAAAAFAGEGLRAAAARAIWGNLLRLSRRRAVRTYVLLLLFAVGKSRSVSS